MSPGINIGEGNCNPFQCSCLENPRDRGAWWAAVYRVAQSSTLLKRLSSSSSSENWRRASYSLFSKLKVIETAEPTHFPSPTVPGRQNRMVDQKDSQACGREQKKELSPDSHLLQNTVTLPTSGHKNALGFGQLLLPQEVLIMCYFLPYGQK